MKYILDLQINLLTNSHDLSCLKSSILKTFFAPIFFFAGQSTQQPITQQTSQGM